MRSCLSHCPPSPSPCPPQERIWEFSAKARGRGQGEGCLLLLKGCLCPNMSLPLSGPPFSPLFKKQRLSEDFYLSNSRVLRVGSTLVNICGSGREGALSQKVGQPLMPGGRTTFGQGQVGPPISEMSRDSQGASRGLLPPG